ncbi:MAG: heavy metal translocating P-type ATPase [Flavobacteriales bacterium AspAUS03]
MIFQEKSIPTDNKNKILHSTYDGHEYGAEEIGWRLWIPAILSLILLLTGVYMDNYLRPGFFKGISRFIWYLTAYLPVGLPVIIQDLRQIARKDFFTEFFLMSIATLGAFYIGKYPEGVAVMLFYSVGELFQNTAVNRAKKNIKALLDIRPKTVSVLREGLYQEVNPKTIAIGETIQVKAGEKVPLDGILIDGSNSSFNTSALTGESRPQSLKEGQSVLAGMINIHKAVTIHVNHVFDDSSLARILDLVQNASAKKAKTEQLIRRLAKIYTPIVVGVAVLLCLLPYLFVENYIFDTWLYRALIFLVISCPCALVISIPLGYFGGIGAASRRGILFKGSNYLDLITQLNTVVMDKTGTLTKGVFNVQKVIPQDISQEELASLTAALESKSTHPAAKAICQWASDRKINYHIATTEEIEEISGHGLKGMINGKTVLAGNAKLLRKFQIAYPAEIDQEVETIVMVAINVKFAGHFIIADEIKEDVLEAIRQMREVGIEKIVMLSGDKSSVAKKTATQLGISEVYGDLLPEDKVDQVEQLKKEPDRVLAFVGDGINDAPVLAASDISITMGGLGSDVAIETADIVIQTDQPSKIVTAVKIGKATRTVVWQNITFSFVVKVIILILGACGIATMWEAVFSDVGVSLIAILNAMRIQKMSF